MSKAVSPYVKVEKRGNEYLITVMKAVLGGHLVAAQGTALISDPLAFKQELLRLVEGAKAGKTRQEIQADGNS